MQTSLVFWFETVIFLIRMGRERVKCHLVSCSELVWLTQGVVGGACEGNTITSVEELVGHSDKCSPTGIP